MLWVLCVRATQDTLSQSLCHTLHFYLKGPRSQSPVCVSVSEEIRGLFSGTCVCARVVCVASILLSVPADTRQHEGTRPNTLGLDLKFNLHSRTIFTLIHVSRT